MKIKLGISLGDTSQDDLLILYLEDAKNEILELTHLEEIPDKLLSTQVELAIIYYNKRGIEGQTSHGEGGISRSFEEGIPKNIMKKILAYRRLPRQSSYSEVGI
ncbi:phage head-tail connector protein [Caminicella sporogenes]|nr:phage head-tail connector protein [Caminicella sporogenes]WIF95025.1 phage head-tail connector protein [Caminicella sporogenes]